MICDAWDVVIVPFPFTDSPVAKRRPALAISHRRFNTSGRVVACIITTSRSARWPGDLELDEAASAKLGPPQSSIIRSMKLFTIDNRLIVRKIGSGQSVLRCGLDRRASPGDPSRFGSGPRATSRESVKVMVAPGRLPPFGMKAEWRLSQEAKRRALETLEDYRETMDGVRARALALLWAGFWSFSS